MLDASDIFGDEADETDKKTSLWSWLFKAMQSRLPESQYTIKSRKRVLESKFAPVGALLTQRLRAGGLIPRNETYHFVAHSKELYRSLMAEAFATELLRKLPLRLWEQKEQEGVDDFWDMPGELLIPGTYGFPITQSAKRLFSVMSDSKRYFIRGSDVVSIAKNGGMYEFEIVEDQALRTIAERFFKEISSVNSKPSKGNGAMQPLTKKRTVLTRDLCSGC